MIRVREVRKTYRLSNDMIMSIRKCPEDDEKDSFDMRIDLCDSQNEIWFTLSTLNEINDVIKLYKDTFVFDKEQETKGNDAWL